MSLYSHIFLFFVAFVVLAPLAWAQSADPPKDLMDKLPDEYIEEAQNFYEQCEADPTMRPYYDCKCLSVKYLDKRIEVGPRVDGSSIMLNIRKECMDVTELAGKAYGKCTNRAPLMPPEVPLEKFCTCYANTYANMFQRKKPGVSSKSIVRLQSAAMVQCRKPENYSKY